jgi:hypothetical protein
MDFPDLVGLAGVKKDSLGRGGLAGVNVRSDADVPNEFEGVTTGHFIFSLLCKVQPKICTQSNSTVKPVRASHGSNPTLPIVSNDPSVAPDTR